MSNEPKGFNPQDHLIKVQGNRSYLPVSAAIAWFRTEHPDWGILCDVAIDADVCLATATIIGTGAAVVATAHKQESRKAFDDYVEKAESGAVGRALRFAGFGTADVDVDVEQPETPQQHAQAAVVPPGPDTCALCGAVMTVGQAAFAKQRFGSVICGKCQKSQK